MPMNRALVLGTGMMGPGIAATLALSGMQATVVSRAWPGMRFPAKRPLADTLTWETLWHAADLSRKLGRDDAALARWTELSTAPNPFRARAYERLAIHYERKEKNHSMALEMTRAARVIDDSPSLAKRESRLAARIPTARPGRLL